ncbi:hypothetical protein BDZ85DRAFT_318354 [Elsinoe ampelina]|uniref:Uncharacterized protein n=1 Tax=Elsinoe ampelina TaxID=302913 RepID=A0A6A6GFY2_9PEZI|nr:hypothetical protein BDZ85DRAFT_318354 [Elsinoe ampelina]
MASTGSVYTGLWTNWEAGPVIGRTLTVDYQTGAYIVAALAIFVRIVGGRMWDVIRFIIFRQSSSPQPEDGLYHQQQAALRNIEGNSQILIVLFDLWLAWRKKVDSVIRRTSRVSIPAIINYIAFAAAGVFVSRVTNARPGSEVLLTRSGTACGYMDFFAAKDLGTPSMAQRLHMFSAYRSIESQAYALSEQCYIGSEPVRSTACPVFGRNLVPWKLTTGVDCPFGAELCDGADTVKLTSGRIDSVHHMGINSESEHTAYLEIESTCSALNITSRLDEGTLSSIRLSTADAKKIGYMNDWYFSSVNLGPSTLIPMNSTYAIPQFVNWKDSSANTTLGSQQISLVDFDSTVGASSTLWGTGYKIDIESATFDATPDVRSFSPIPSLHHPNSTLNLLILANRNIYSNPVHSPWFTATQPAPVEGMYLPTFPLSVLAYTTTRLLCLPTNPPTCTPLFPDPGRTPSIPTNASLPFTSPVQRSIATRLARAATDTDLFDPLRNRGADALLASRLSRVQSSMGLPADQWIKELSHLFSVGMIQLQAASYLFAGDVAGAGSVARSKPSAEEEWMCGAQVVSSEAFSSFSVLGLAIVLGVGGLVVLLSLVVEGGTHWVERKMGTALYRQEEWRDLGLWWLMRGACEGRVTGEWEGKGEVPTTRERGERWVMPCGYMDGEERGDDTARGEAKRASAMEQRVDEGWGEQERLYAERGWIAPGTAR